MEHARNAFTFIPHIHANKIRNKIQGGLLFWVKYSGCVSSLIQCGYSMNHSALFPNYSTTQSAQAGSLTKCKYEETVFYQEREDYSPFPLQCNRGISLIESRHKFSLTLLLKDILAKQVKLKYYTQVPT